MMNALEKLTESIKAWNADAEDWEKAFRDAAAARAEIVERGQALGLKFRKLDAMLAKVSVAVRMPKGDTQGAAAKQAGRESDDDSPATQAPVEDAETAANEPAGDPLEIPVFLRRKA
jgi:hypothetical protein